MKTKYFRLTVPKQTKKALQQIKEEKGVNRNILLLLALSSAVEDGWKPTNQDIFKMFFDNDAEKIMITTEKENIALDIQNYAKQIDTAVFGVAKTIGACLTNYLEKHYPEYFEEEDK